WHAITVAVSGGRCAGGGCNGRCSGCRSAAATTKDVRQTKGYSIDIVGAVVGVMPAGISAKTPAGSDVVLDARAQGQGQGVTDEGARIAFQVHDAHHQDWFEVTLYIEMIKAVDLPVLELHVDVGAGEL